MHVGGEPDRVFDAGSGAYGRWFPGAECNTCHNAVDRHVAGGRAGQVALIYDSPITGALKKFTYAELKAEVEDVLNLDLPIPEWAAQCLSITGPVSTYIFPSACGSSPLIKASSVSSFRFNTSW